MIRFGFIALLALVGLPGIAFAGTVTHTVYAASAFSDGGLQLRWNSTPDGWIPENSLTHHRLVDFDCTSLLEHQQMFALGAMVKRGVLTAEQAKMYAALGDKLPPRQVSFFELEEKGQQVGSLWSVGGQDLEAGKIQDRILPWMLEEKWKALAGEVDRTKYKYLWEWGRAAIEDGADIDTLLDFAVQKAYRDLKTFGGKVDDAYVMIHAISPAHTVSYLRRFPGTQFSKNALKDGDSVLMIPLSMVLKSHPLRRHSALLADLGKIVDDPRFTDDILVDLVDAFRGTLWTEADFQGTHFRSDHPLILQDFSVWGLNSVHAQLRAAGIPEAKSKAAIERLLQEPITKRLQRANYYVDATNKNGAQILCRDRGAVEVSGLDPKQLADDPKYLLRVLFGAAIGAVRKVQAISPQSSIRDVWQSLILRRSEIALTTRDPAMADAIRKLKPEYSKGFVSLPVPPGTPKEMAAALGDDWGTTTEAFFFPFGRILEMTMEDPTLDQVFNDAANRIIRGNFQRNYSFVNPELF
ncbi:MAG: hypothetical protein JST04_12000 [Bdellovibrionales bacterium]|nr:hypothetical protein [Bdellovibrionales bacterium]